MLKSSCCGTLRQGSLFIGWMTVIIKTIGLFICLGIFVTALICISEIEKNLNPNEHTNKLRNKRFLMDPNWNEPIIKSGDGEFSMDLNLNEPKIKVGGGEFSMDLNPNEPKIKSGDGEFSMDLNLNEPKIKVGGGEFSMDLNPNEPKIKSGDGEFSMDLNLNEPKIKVGGEGFSMDLNPNKATIKVKDGEISCSVTNPKEAIKVFIGLTIVCGVLLAPSILLIIGIKKENENYLLPWICTELLSIVAIVAYSIYSLATNNAGAASALYIALEIYMLLVVFSHYKELMERNNADREGLISS